MRESVLRWRVRGSWGCPMRAYEEFSERIERSERQALSTLLRMCMGYVGAEAVRAGARVLP